MRSDLLDNEVLQAIARFKKRRSLSAWLFSAGITALMIHFLVFGPDFRFSFDSIKEIVVRSLALAGLVALVIGSILVSLVGKCPVCRKSFRSHSNFEDGLPVFNRISECPFCKVKLEGET